MDKISVIVPVYKAEAFLDRCVLSLVNQSYENIEIILVDDDSPDNCPAMCNAWAKKDSRIKVIHKENNGVSEARRAGVEASTGDYVAFVDSDDWVRRDMYEYLLSLIKSGAYPVSACSYELVGDSNEPEDTSSDDTRELDFDDMMKQLYDYNLWSVWGKLYKRELFDAPIPEIKLAVSEDLLLNYFILKQCEKIIVSKKRKYFYFRHEGSVMRSGVSKLYITNSLQAYKTISEDMDASSLAYAHHSANRVKNDFRLINEVIKQTNDKELYNMVRSDFIDVYKYVFASENKYAFTIFNKVLAILLAKLPFVYNFVTKKFR